MQTARLSCKSALRVFTSAALAIGLCGALGCSDATPDLGAAALPQRETQHAEQILVEAAPGLIEILTAGEAVPLASELPAPAVKAIARSAREHASAKLETPPAQSYVPLESLLRTPHGSSAPVPIDLSALGEQPISSGPPAPQGVLDVWKDRVRMNRRSEPFGHAGAKQGTLSQTYVSLRIPVDESVSFEGGVRVDQREEPTVDEPVRQSIPRVGVEVKF